MARLLQTPPFIGTKDGIVVYKRWGRYYVRTRSNLTAVGIKNSPAFPRIMESAQLLGRASKIASKIYQQLSEKRFEQFRILTGIAMSYLKAGLNEEETLLKMYNSSEFL